MSIAMGIMKKLFKLSKSIHLIKIVELEKLDFVWILMFMVYCWFHFAFINEISNLNKFIT